MHESESEVAQSCTTLSDPMDCRPPGSSIHGIFQAGVLEWGVIAFSDQIEWPSSKSLQTINAEESVEKREPSYIVGKVANLYSHYGEHVDIP